jgi:potassium efflux system protein
LQEIFANFVAGLIVLFERPIRVGDIVTVNDITGTVSKIRIRATTITNFDRKELVVPNKEFITSRILNWTLENAVNRIVINVGISYSNDPAVARQVLLKVAGEHPLVLKDPAPVATFDSFGDSSLNLILRAFLPNLDNRVEVIHGLNTEIRSQFAENGIEIPFPQRDINLSSMPPNLQSKIGNPLLGVK